MASKMEENALQKIWPQAVGPQIASKTRPDSLRNGTLFVKTISSVWVQQLHFIKDEILDKLNRFSKNSPVREIRFTVGHSPSSEKKAGFEFSGRKISLKKRDKEMIDECTGSLDDRELAEILKRVMQLEISRRRRMEEGKAP